MEKKRMSRVAAEVEEEKKALTGRVWRKASLRRESQFAYIKQETRPKGGGQGMRRSSREGDGSVAI